MGLADGPVSRDAERVGDMADILPLGQRGIVSGGEDVSRRVCGFADGLLDPINQPPTRNIPICRKHAVVLDATQPHTPK